MEVSRGDQILNAESFEKQGFSYVIHEEELTSDRLLEAVKKVYEGRNEYIHSMEASDQHNAVVKVADIIDEVRIK